MFIEKVEKIECEEYEKEAFQIVENVVHDLLERIDEKGGSSYVSCINGDDYNGYHLKNFLDFLGEFPNGAEIV